VTIDSQPAARRHPQPRHNPEPMYFESIMISATERRYAVYNNRGQMVFYTSSVLAARMFMAGKNTNMWSGG